MVSGEPRPEPQEARSLSGAQYGEARRMRVKVGEQKRSKKRWVKASTKVIETRLQHNKKGNNLKSANVQNEE